MKQTLQKRVLLTCRAMQLVCVLVAMALIGGAMWGLTHAPMYLQAYGEHRGLIVVPSDFSAVQWGLVCALVAVPLAALCYGLYRLFSLFQLFARSIYFTASTVSHLLAFALALLVAVVASMLSNTALSLVATWNNPEGLRALNVSFGSHELLLLLFAAVFAVIAWVFTEAILLAEENAEII